MYATRLVVKVAMFHDFLPPQKTLPRKMPKIILKSEIAIFYDKKRGPGAL